ncbi:hypothetical protein ACI2KS_10480 [Pseudomonas sp. NPDC087358]|uniref:hypothetical protein n=1 Tax=Pseudomonas sp. NPDC087358 TaxID=3364439 RepID=UPI00384E3512
MNPIAQRALNRALHLPVRAAPLTARKAATKTRCVPAPEPVIAGELDLPIKPDLPAKLDRFGFIEGKNYALDTARSMTALLTSPGGRLEIIQRLKRVAAGKPASQALGIWTVIEAIETADG